MKQSVIVRFCVNGNIPVGQEIRVCGSHRRLGAWNSVQAMNLRWGSDGCWEGSVQLGLRDVVDVTYRYFTCPAGKPAEAQWELGDIRTMKDMFREDDLEDGYVYNIHDNYGDQMDGQSVDAFFRNAFKRPSPVCRKSIPEIVAHGSPLLSPSSNQDGEIPETPLSERSVFGIDDVDDYDNDDAYQLVVFRVHYPHAKCNETIGICGSTPALGKWQEENVVPCCDGNYPIFECPVYIEKSNFPIEFKFVILGGGGKIIWEHGENRELFTSDTIHRHDVSAMIINCGELKRGPDFHPPLFSGVSIALFSLRSRASIGCGDFLDLSTFVEWCSRCGLSCVELLPLNDTIRTHSNSDRFPHRPISAFALHPMYINLPELASYCSIEGPVPSYIGVELREKPSTKGKAMGVSVSIQTFDVLSLMNRLRERLDGDRLRYSCTVEEKLRVSKEFCSKWFENGGDEKDVSYGEFVRTHAHWLRGYALFSSLRDRFGSSDWRSHWPEEFQLMSRADIRHYTAKDSHLYEDIRFWYFMQYHLHRQIDLVRKTALHHGVCLKATIPSGVNPFSVDVWMHPHLFRLSESCGAPPDSMRPQGQKWGMPSFNWESMRVEEYDWWKRRLAHFERYFGCVRIDHIGGFFRTWRVSSDHVSGSLGYYSPSRGFFRDELHQVGLFDVDRLCRPEFDEYEIDSLFGSDRPMNFLKRIGDGPSWTFRDEFRREVDVVEEALRGGHQSSLKRLLNLFSSRCLIRETEKPNQVFHPRKNLFGTAQFRLLPQPYQSALMHLHHSYFDERNKELWEASGFEKIKVVKTSTRMLLCADDLGDLPSQAHLVLDKIGLLRLKIQRVTGSVHDRSMQNPFEYPYNSVCMPSAHDMTTLREFWEEDRSVAQYVYSEHLHRFGKAPDTCEPWIARDILSQHLHAPSMFTIFMIPDLLAIDGVLRHPIPHEERLVHESEPSLSWTYRMHLLLDDLMSSHTYFADDIRNLVEGSGRLGTHDQ
eukprot:TRINITY_DN82252_c0_g1_i1.p1 TRINITY_DN82252_c0_g1~~TRINITY_DN82252_c0_g1_i1.p1  ORF type:complete len:990 (-),score=211.77 TRINITY_DN82252_c0_g1_i1:74-3043(-)